METKMRTLSRFELAIVKRTAQNTKSLRTKRDKLAEKIAKAQQEMDEINQMIDRFEAPVVEMTGGYNSEQVLAYISEKEAEVETADEGNTESTETVETTENVCEEAPFTPEEATTEMPWDEE